MKEYFNVVHREGWGSGEWDSEPDKVEWSAYGQACLALRGPFGSWCGYVGVAKNHILHGTDFSNHVDLPTDILADLLEARGVLNLYSEELLKGEVRLDGILACHGGVTYANGSTVINRSEWRKYAQFLNISKREADRCPKGDAAQRIREWGPVIGIYEEWAERKYTRGICHEDFPDAWWIGFDCSHAGDFVPGMEAVMREISQAPRSKHDVYRTLDYVKNEVEELAHQLKEIADLAGD